MSLHDGSLQRAQKLLKKRSSIVWARGSLRMILHAENGQVSVPETFYRPVVQVHMSDLQVPGSFDRSVIAFNSKTVILGSDQNPSGLDLLHGMISPSVAVRHLYSGATVCEP